ncbi:metallophosphoesterase 1 isoform X2 [Erpetoichthys calabaricus]|uniref:metallophosphoesterase 1 isoform X2 n=1 Tax=Erpetoichthys calabaricus TaxID=27687 RepID=UPI00109FC94B|nr:metallophosphoesterase 1 isoform X2 [Erpetoichthys calabaricus]
MPGLCGKGKFAFISLWFIICVFVFCEFLIYYTVMFSCVWPDNEATLSSQRGEGSTPVLKTLVLSDTHLLGAINGHWFDKVRREWQMERAFQTALWLLQPEIVFILGDIFDEGKWSSSEDWEDDVRRFRQMFRHPTNTELLVVVGNHDIGFHYEMSWFKLQRFEKVFNITSARIVTKKGVNFLLVNSVALHGDGCSICQDVEDELIKISRALNCSIQKNVMKEQCRDIEHLPASRPILLQHYPLYRISDVECTGEDAATLEERNLVFKQQYDSLSLVASHKLLWWFQPRLILSGHTHSACEKLHSGKFLEISVPSFSWRNRNNPSFILGSISSYNFTLSKCFLPRESTVISIYCSAGALLIIIILTYCQLLKKNLHYAQCLVSKHKIL